ncbi:hypothetical protein HORIV_25140 [Vreelandella olivaria]|uniref:Phosphatidylserine decarboxylase n=1 Tax=Vreelandella olivaria TaxID=390919 RepID=A0ABM7GI01_9GAMM|nr:hypothetical protein HORIV_25140 [Halomonas olivaria]
MPHHALSRLTGQFAQCDNRWVKDTLIKAFIKRFNVDMSQALEPDPTAYATFNDFFTRALKPMPAHWAKASSAPPMARSPNMGVCRQGNWCKRKATPTQRKPC